MSAIGAVLDHFGGSPPPPRHGWQQTKCPFHEDRNPSAAVNYAEGRFHCFVCGIHEDAIGLIMEIENVDFPTAKRRAEEIAENVAPSIPAASALGDWFPDRKGNKTRMGGEVAAWREALRNET